MRKRVLACISLTLMMVIGNEIHASTASAGLSSVRNDGGTSSLSTGYWGAVATTTPLTPGTSAYVNSNVPAAGSGAGNGGSFFSIVNTGTLTLLDVTIQLTTTTTKSNSYVVTIHGCSVAWNEVTGACSGTLTALYTLSVPTSGTLAQKTSTGIASIPVTAGANKRLRIQYVGGGSPTIGSTINMPIVRANARAATNTNS
jgi:hypothetical protein